MTGKIAVTIRIDKEVWKEAKKYAIDLDMKIGSFVETCILHQMRQRVTKR